MRLPTGMALTAATGVISGKPSVAGVYSFAVTVSDGGGASITSTYTVNVSAADGAAVLQVINSMLLDDE